MGDPQMTTKRKCHAIAEANGISIFVSENFGYEYSLSLPKGLQMEKYEGSRTGLSKCDIPTKKELWREMSADLCTMIGYKPWPKVTDYEN
jgi:hypothetical protein